MLFFREYYEAGNIPFKATKTILGLGRKEKTPNKEGKREKALISHPKSFLIRNILYF
jgi:hypothetical protein